MGWAGSRLGPNISPINKWANLGLSGRKYEAQLGPAQLYITQGEYEFDQKKRKKMEKYLKYGEKK